MTDKKPVGKKTQTAKHLKMRSLPPDDPIYPRGFVIGGKRLGDSTQ